MNAARCVNEIDVFGSWLETCLTFFAGQRWSVCRTSAVIECFITLILIDTVIFCKPLRKSFWL